MTSLTVVSAVYNLVEQGRADTFRQMVASVAVQGRGDVEHLIIDGASKDGTLSLIEQAAATHPGLTWHSEPDTGIYDAMNKGAAKASGRYLHFLNSDDFFHDPAALTRVLGRLEATGADFAYCAASVLKTDGRTRTLRPKLLRFLRGMPFNHQAMVLRRDLFWDLGGFDPSLRILSDFKLTLALLLGDAKGVDAGAPIVTFRAGGQSSDRARAVREKALIYADAFADFIDMSAQDWERYAARGKLPFALLLKIAAGGKVNGRTRRAALYEMQNAVLKPGGV
jgi:glycosyltransferase involved in cell wall biosynthesis